MDPFPLLVLLIVALMLLELPLFTALAGLSLVCFYAIDGDPLALQSILIEMNRLASMPVLIALPLFTCLGSLLTHSGAPRRIVILLRATLGWMPGGVGTAALCSCAVFTALTGASGVTIVALGGVLYPVLREAGYDETLILGLITTAGSLGLLFPPSLPVILYGVVGQVDIQQVFTAAAVPGLLMVIVLAAYVVLKRRGQAPPAGRARTADPASGGRIREALAASKWDWPLIVILFVGIYGGFATVVEIAAVILVYAIVVECFILKEIDFRDQLPKVLVESALLSGALVVILGFALGFTGYLVEEQIPNRLLALLSRLTDSRLLFLACLNLFLLLVGCLMDIFSAIVIVVPIMVPVALEFGIDPIHLGVIFLVNLEIGYATPPVGMNLFIASMKFEKPITRLYRASLPFLLLLLVLLLLITYVPVLSLFMID
jgi:tripartite ATP-independent transporter DctM subunit